MRTSIWTLGAVVVVLGACGPAADRASEDASPAEAVAVQRTLADFAGAWTGTATLTDEAPVPLTIDGTEDPLSWRMMLHDRPEIILQVSVEGDSLIALSSRFESVIRQGVMVMVRTAQVVEDGALVGHIISTYDTPAGQEVVQGTIRLTKNP